MKTLSFRNVPDELHREAKVAAAKEGKTLQEWFIEAIREKLERQKQPK